MSAGETPTEQLPVPLAPVTDDVTLATDLRVEDAQSQISAAVTGRRGIARKYVLGIRRRHPEATPAEIIGMLERHYVTAISLAGATISAVTIAAEIGIAMIPGVSAAAAGSKAAAKEAGKRATKEVAKVAAKQTMKTAAKSVGLNVAKGGAQKVAAMLPAGDEQLQFEITSLFALSLADIHGLEYDEKQALALVYGLSNERVSQTQIATMAKDLAVSKGAEPTAVAQAIADGRSDWSHWANTLADSLPGGAAESLVRGVQTGVLDEVRSSLDGKQQAAVEYGVGALVGGIARFVFGREVVDAAHLAFAAAPEAFPPHLLVQPKNEFDSAEPNRALESLENAAKSVGAGVNAGAAAVSSGVVRAAGAVTSPFRKVDLDGDGIPDEARAASAIKGLGSAISGAAGAVSTPFRRVDLDGDGELDEARAATAIKGVGSAIVGKAGAFGSALKTPFKSSRKRSHSDEIVDGVLPTDGVDPDPSVLGKP